MIDVNIKKLSENATIPTYAHVGDAGMDMYSAEDVVIPYGEMRKVPTDIAMAIPEGLVGLLYPRSGLASKQGLRLSNCVGVIDSSYRGNIIAAVFNDSAEPRIIKKGDRICQLILTPFFSGNLIEVDKLDDTERSDKGFGSSGVN